jgi:excisionase family DNA binding protein
VTFEDTIRATVRDVVREELRPLRELLEQLAPRASDDLLTVRQAAELAHVHPNTVRNWIEDGQLPRRRSGRKYLVERVALRKLLEVGPRRPPAEQAPVDVAAAILARRRRTA